MLTPVFALFLAAGVAVSPAVGAVSENVEVAHRRLIGEFLRPEGLLCDYVGEIPTPRDCAECRPNAMGWWSPIENGPMFTGPYLRACIARANRLRGKAEYASARAECAKMAAGLIRAASVSDVPGMIVRGFGTDGKCHYPLGSDDQTLPWFYGLHAWVTSDLPTPGERAAAVDKMKEVAAALEANNWRLPCDGRFKGENRGGFGRRGALVFRVATHGMYLFAAMHEITGDAHWRDLYRRYRDEKLEGREWTGSDVCEAGWRHDVPHFSVEGNGMWIYVCAQGCLAELIRMEPDRALAARWRRGLEYNAERARRFLADAAKFDNRMERPFRYANWRTGYRWREQPTQKIADEVANTGNVEVLGRRKQYERNFMTTPLSAAAICAFAGRYADEVEKTISRYDYNEINICEFFLAEIAWEKLQEGNRRAGTQDIQTSVKKTAARKGVRAAWVLDAGRPVQATGLRFRADASRRYCRTPGAARVYAVENADGSGARRELARDDRLPPAFAGESSFLRWSAATSRYWLVEATSGGTDALVRFGQYFHWVFPRTKTRWGIPCNGDAGTGDDCTPAAIELFDAEPADYPRQNAPDCAFPDYRLVKDWLMQDFGVEGAVTNRPVDMAAYLAACRARRVERLRRVAKECPRIVYVKHYTMGGDAELHGTALVTDEQVTGRPANFRKGGQLCLLTVRPDGTVTNEVLVSRPEGCIRDPDVSFDGRLVVFSMRSSFNENAYIRRLPKAGPGGPTRDRGFPYDFYTKLEGDDYHLYTFDLETRELKQLTFSDPAPCADIEPCWTSGGEIVFQSSRCEQTIPCHQTQDVNLYVCRADGTHIRRLAIDGGCTSHPRELPDGRILYTRYEYNDRSARLQQPLFVMNPDGTQQQAYYGNASAFPASLMHFRPVPGSDEVMGVLSGHHVHQQGKLVRLDRRKGTENDAGIVFIAGSDILERGLTVPSDYAKDKRMVEEWHPDSIDFITQTGAQWQNPYPLSGDEWICGFLPEGTLTIKNSSCPGFGIYWQNGKGERELLAWDASIECSQAVPARPRAKAFVRALPQRNRQDPFGIFHIQDVYTGPGLAGIPRGTVKTLRVVAVENRPTYTYSCAMPAPADGPYRPFLAYSGDHSGEAVTAGGAWDVKHVLGEVDVAADGGCTFRCPANNPVYFQLLDERGRCVQTMRSWTHLQPGEAASCVGCHEDKAQAYPPRAGQSAMKIQELRPARGLPAHPLLERLKKEGLYASAANYLGVNGPVDVRAEAPVAGFSFPRLVQPILDRNCVKCHDGRGENAKRPNLTGAHRKNFRPQAHRAFSHAYAALTQEGKQTVFCNWYSCMGRSAMLPPYAQGSAKSILMAYFEPVHHGVTVTEDEKRVVQCWIDLAIPFVGSYCEATEWTDDDRKVYDYHQRKRVAFAQRELENRD